MHTIPLLSTSRSRLSAEAERQLLRCPRDTKCLGPPGSNPFDCTNPRGLDL